MFDVQDSGSSTPSVLTLYFLMESGGFAAEPADFIVNEAHLVNRYRAMLGENNV